MGLLQRMIIGILLAMVLGLAMARAEEETRTVPAESLNGLRPGIAVQDVIKEHGDPDVTASNGLLGLYGGAEESMGYGWYMIEDPPYTVPDLAVETARDSDRVDLVMALGHEGFRTERGITCFQSEADVLEAYGEPTFAFAVPMQGFVLYEIYYPELGLSFDLAAIGPSGDREVVAIYVTYPEYLERAIGIRKALIGQGIGREVTYLFNGGREA